MSKKHSPANPTGAQSAPATELCPINGAETGLRLARFSACIQAKALLCSPALPSSAMGIIAGRSRQASGPVKQVPPGLGSLLGVPMGLVLVLAGGLLGMGLSALVIVPSGSLGQGEIPVGALLLLILLAVGLTLGATLLTALGAAREKPLNVLRYE